MIYLDNAATTYPKPEEVYKAMDFVNRNLAMNPGRGGYSKAKEAENIIDTLSADGDILKEIVIYLTGRTY